MISIVVAPSSCCVTAPLWRCDAGSGSHPPHLLLSRQKSGLQSPPLRPKGELRRPKGKLRNDSTPLLIRVSNKKLQEGKKLETLAPPDVAPPEAKKKTPGEGQRERRKKQRAGDAEPVSAAQADTAWDSDDELLRGLRGLAHSLRLVANFSATCGLTAVPIPSRPLQSPRAARSGFESSPISFRRRINGRCGSWTNETEPASIRL